MDRISRALEIARTQQHHGRVHPGSHDEIGEIDYSMTQKAHVEPRVLRSHRVVNETTKAQVVDAYRLLRTRVLHRMAQNGWNTLGVTSTAPREGKTLTAVNLGISIAAGKRHTVMVVDADLRHPSIHALFRIRPTDGLAGYLNGRATIDEVLVNPGIESFVILPGSPHGKGGIGHLASPKMESLARELKARYTNRIVIFDLPPILVGDDVVAFAPHLDAVLLVIEDGNTDAADCRRAVDLLDGVNVIGTVLNKADEVTSAYGDYYY